MRVLVRERRPGRQVGASPLRRERHVLPCSGAFRSRKPLRELARSRASIIASGSPPLAMTRSPGPGAPCGTWPSHNKEQASCATDLGRTMTDLGHFLTDLGHITLFFLLRSASPSLLVLPSPEPRRLSYHSSSKRRNFKGKYCSFGYDAPAPAESRFFRSRKEPGTITVPGVPGSRSRPPQRAI